MDELEKQIAKGLSFYKIGFDQNIILRLVKFIQELDRWNTRFGFIKADMEELISLHLLDALAGLALLKRFLPAGVILDFGSGAGFPGLPLALFMAEHRFVLCERKAKENAFLKNAAALLGLNNVRVVNDLVQVEKNSLDAVVFRAVTSIKEIYSIVQCYLAPAGILFAYKGKKEKIDQEAAEMDGLNLQAEVHKLAVPGVNRERHIVVVRRNQ